MVAQYVLGVTALQPSANLDELAKSIVVVVLIGGKSTPLEEFILCACLGYFLFDIGWCFLQPQRESLLMLVHHTISIVALTYVLATGFSATELIGTIFGAEASNPFLQIRLVTH